MNHSPSHLSEETKMKRKMKALPLINTVELRNLMRKAIAANNFRAVLFFTDKVVDIRTRRVSCWISRGMPWFTSTKVSQKAINAVLETLALNGATNVKYTTCVGFRGLPHIRATARFEGR